MPTKSNPLTNPNKGGGGIKIDKEKISQIFVAK